MQDVNHFNPRTPCGVRQYTLADLCGELDFNPRTPCGVRQPRAPATGATYLFQSTHPVRGATIISLIVLRAHVDFNPRTPCGVRRRMVTKYVLEKAISIHAPRAGCDAGGG